MKFGSVCSGIEAASVAWHRLGWKAAWLAEIEKFASAVLAHHYPDVPNLGDMMNIVRLVLRGDIEAPDVFTGGTPCQAFSVAGKRESLSDARGNLSLTFCEIANAIDHVRAGRGEEPCIVMWENVPGILSTRDNAFGCFLGALAGAGCELQPPGGRWSDAGCVYGPGRAVAWRVLDAQYFGVAQRRKRVFVVASARAGFDPAAILFEREGVRRDYPPIREAGKGITGGTSRRPYSGHVVNSLTANNGQRNEIADVVNGSVIPWPAELACTLNAAFGDKQALEDQHALSGASLFVKQSQSVRRITPRECERLQGFPDDYTLIPYRGKAAEDCPDGPRYKALGNSWAVPCARWIGERIAAEVA